MAVNLAKSMADKIAKKWTQNSYLAGKVNTEFKFTGLKTLEVMTPITQGLVDYTRSGVNRYGTPAEMQDTVQEMTVTQDKGFALTVDKGNLNQQQMLKKSGVVMDMQLKEQIVPTTDKYSFQKFVAEAGTIKGIAKPTKTTVVEAVMDALQVLDDNSVPLENVFLFVTAEIYKLLKLSPEFLGPDDLAKQALGKGYVGEISNAKVIKVRSDFLPANCYFLLAHKDALINPYQVNDLFVHENPPGISGNLIEGRVVYDAFVLGAKSMGVYAAVASGEQQAAPTIANGSAGAVTITSSGADKILYTLDGSDPRYSNTAAIYSAALSGVASGTTVQAVAMKEGKFPSNVESAVTTQ